MTENERKTKKIRVEFIGSDKSEDWRIMRNLFDLLNGTQPPERRLLDDVQSVDEEKRLFDLVVLAGPSYVRVVHQLRILNASLKFANEEEIAAELAKIRNGEND